MADEIEKRDEVFLIYQDENGIARVNVRFEGEDVWLNVEQMMELRMVSRQRRSSERDFPRKQIGSKLQV